jgi:hypothetical protein
MSGNMLENFGSVEVYSKGSKSTQFLANLEQIPKGKKKVSQRKINMTFKGGQSASTIYRINFRRDLNSVIFYSEDFTVVKAN